VVRKFFRSDVEGIESVGAVGAVFEQVFLGFGKLFSGLVLAKAVASTQQPCGLDCEDKVFVVGAVEERHKALLTGEALIYLCSWNINDVGT